MPLGRKSRIRVVVALACVIGLSWAWAWRAGERGATATPIAGDAPLPMTNTRLEAMIARLDPEATGGDGRWELTVEGRRVLVLTDVNADRARIMVPVADVGADTLSPELLVRMLQANFDAVLDARYCVARGRVWAAFLHPLGSLTEREFVAGLGQTITAAATFGTTFTSGALVFGGGDSAAAHETYNRIMEKGIGF